MQIIEVHNPDARLLVDWMARQVRAREVMIRRFLHWSARKSPDVAQNIADVDAVLKQNARNYMKSAP
jgi:hypothetical protein